MRLSKHLLGAPLLALAMLVASPSPARADATAFLGLGRTTNTHPMVKGVAFGIGLIVVGFEVEGAQHNGDPLTNEPSLKTGLGNILVQTPTGDTQFYATAGAGLYQESLGTNTTTNFATNIGGGIKVAITGPLRLRADLRIIHLNGTPKYTDITRFYVGANLKF